LKEKFEYFVSGRLNIPQIEFTLTTRCTLRCKHCTNYISHLEKHEHSTMTFEDFKMQLDNLTGAVNKIYNLLLLGGEPLLVKELPEMLEYAAQNRKIKNIWITTNGTLPLSENLIQSIRKYRDKTVVWLSNYSRNEELTLKHEELLAQMQDNNFQYIFNEDLTWSYVTEEIKDYSRSRKENADYFLKCLHPCLSVYDGKLFVCPRAGVFYLKNLYQFDEGEEISLNSPPKELRKQLIHFYERDYFSACNLCNWSYDRQQARIMPAQQLERNLA